VDLKRARLEKDVLEGMLFRLFERQSTWNFNQLQKETDQPAMWLKVSCSSRWKASHTASASPACMLCGRPTSAASVVLVWIACDVNVKCI